jgi:hypothetical protein
MLTAIALALFALTTQPASTAPGSDTAAEAAIRAIVAEQVVAWDAGDAKGYASHLAPDASTTSTSSRPADLLPRTPPQHFGR